MSLSLVLKVMVFSSMLAESVCKAVQDWRFGLSFQDSFDCQGLTVSVRAVYSRQAPFSMSVRFSGHDATDGVFRVSALGVVGGIRCQFFVSMQGSERVVVESFVPESDYAEVVREGWASVTVMQHLRGFLVSRSFLW